MLISSFDRRFKVWHYSVSYSRLLLRSLEDDRIDVLFSNVQLMHIARSYSSLEILAEEGWAPEGINQRFEDPGQWFILNSGAGYIYATHCQWHQDTGNAMTPSRFGPFSQTE